MLLHWGQVITMYCLLSLQLKTKKTLNICQLKFNYWKENYNELDNFLVNVTGTPLLTIVIFMQLRERFLNSI